jgi:hypothetical protein
MTRFDPLPWAGSDSTPPLNRDSRRPVELDGHIIRANDEVVAVKVVDLSYDGCAVRIATTLRIAETLKLAVSGRGMIDASVRWLQNGEAGLLFEADKPAKPHYPRKSERVAVTGEAALRRAGCHAYAVRLSDVSRFGCKCSFVERPAESERAWIKFPGSEELEATVSWVEEDSIGLVYRNPLHPAVFALQLERFNVQSRRGD